MLRRAPDGPCDSSAVTHGPDSPSRPPSNGLAAAEARLANIPAFVRPMARTGIETFARERGVAQVDETVLDAARDFFGM